MNSIYKYKLPMTIPLQASQATNDANAATGIAAGGGYEGAINDFTAIGVPVPINIGDNVAAIPTVIATYEGVMVTYNTYDIPLAGIASVAGTPNIYKIPLLNLGIDPINQKVNGIDVRNTFNPLTGDIFPVSDRFFFKFDAVRKAIYFGYPNIDEANYVGRGIKLTVALIATKI